MSSFKRASSWRNTAPADYSRTGVSCGPCKTPGATRQRHKSQPIRLWKETEIALMSSVGELFDLEHSHPGLIAQPKEFRMIRMVLFQPEHRLCEPLLSEFLISLVRVSHGQKEVIKGRTSLAKSSRAIEGGDRAIQTAGALLNCPQRVPVGAALRLCCCCAAGQCERTNRVSHRWVRSGH